MCIRNYIKAIVEDYLERNPHPVEDHTHENYVDKKDIGFVFFGNNAEVQWNTSINGVSTSVYLDIKTIQ
jgi:hypothetical protein